MRRLGRSLADRAERLAVGKAARRARIAEVAALLRPVDCGIPLIRMGGANDGGYLVPDDLEGVSHCFSPGVDDRAQFEMECSTRGIASFLADGTVSGPPSYLADCHFTRMNLGPRTTPQTMTLDDWVASSLPPNLGGDLILQMDIEGAEFDVLATARDETLARFRIAVIEFHGGHRLDRPSVRRRWLRCLTRLAGIFDVVHLHPNNCCGIANVDGFQVPRVMEVTLLRKDRTKARRPVAKLPNPLDQPNLTDRPDIVLPQEWLV